MQANATKGIVVVAALAVLAALVWWLTRPPTPLPTPQVGSADAGAAVPGLPAAPSPTALPAAPSPSALPEAPTISGAPQPAAELPGSAFVVRSKADGPKALELAIDKAGGRAVLQPLRRSTWQRFASGASVTQSGDLLLDDMRAVLVEDRDGGFTVGVAGEHCWTVRDDVVVPCEPRDRDFATKWQYLHAATVLLPLLEPPFQLVDAAAAEHGGHVLNVLRFSSGEGAPELLLYLHPVDHHLVLFETTLHDECCGMRVEFEDRRKLAGALLPAIRRIETPGLWQAGPQVLVDRVIDVSVGVDPKRLTPPPLTRDRRLQVAARPAMVVVQSPVATLDRFHESVDPVVKHLTSHYQMLQMRLTLALGPAAGPQQDLALWASFRDVQQLGRALKEKVVVIPAEPRVALQVVRVPFSKIISEFQRFVAAAQAAGHTPGSGRPAVRFFGAPDPQTQDITVELQLPLRAAP